MFYFYPKSNLPKIKYYNFGMKFNEQFYQLYAEALDHENWITALLLHKMQDL
jgi:hypothetical protein